MTAEPGGDCLVEDELDILVTREAQRHHEAPRAPRCTGRIAQPGTRAKIHLRRLAGRERDRYGRLGRPVRVDHRKQSMHGRVAAGVVVLAAERCVDRHPGDAFGVPALDEGPVRFGRRDRRTGTAHRTDRCRDLCVIRQRRTGDQPALTSRQRPKGCDLPPPHQPATGNVALRITLTQSRQNLSILEHLDPPPTHRSLPPPSMA